MRKELHHSWDWKKFWMILNSGAGLQGTKWSAHRQATRDAGSERAGCKANAC